MTRRLGDALARANSLQQPRGWTTLRRCTAIGAALACLLSSAGVGSAVAHDLVQEQVVQVSIRSTPGVLMVQLQIPVDALPSTALPRTPDGALDAPALAEPMRVVAADAVRNLDLLEHGASLRQTAFVVQLAADRAAIGVDVTYATRGVTGFSARLGTFVGTPQRPVRTAVDFTTAGGQRLPLSVVGPPVRVALDPPPADVVVRFLRQGVLQMLGFGVAVLLLICILLPLRTGPEAAALIALVILAEVVGLLTGLATSWPSGAVAAATALVAATAVVVAALQVLGGARLRLVMTVVGIFGLAYGASLAPGMASSGQMAGTHPVLAVATTVVTLAVMHAWIGAVLWVTRAWLHTKSVPAYGFAAFVAVLVGHSALHHVMTHASAAGGSATFFSGHALVIVTLGWMLLAAGLALAAPGRTPPGTRRQPSLSQQPLT